MEGGWSDKQKTLISELIQGGELVRAAENPPQLGVIGRDTRSADSGHPEFVPEVPPDSQDERFRHMPAPACPGRQIRARQRTCINNLFQREPLRR